MAIEATGKVHKVFETKQISDRFTKREFVLELDSDGKYPQLVVFELTGDKCGDLDSVQLGEELHVEFNLRGREWKSPSGDIKYFTTLNAWKIKRTSKALQKATPIAEIPASPPPVDEEDIPF